MVIRYQQRYRKIKYIMNPVENDMIIKHIYKGLNAVLVNLENKAKIHEEARVNQMILDAKMNRKMKRKN